MAICNVTDFLSRILEKQNRLQMSQVFFRVRALIIRWFCFSRILSEAASPKRRRSQRNLNSLTSRRSEARACW